MATGLDAQQKIFASNPDDRRAFEALEEHFFLEGDWEPLVALYRARIAAPSVEEDPDQLSPLLFRLGQILEERLLDLHAATETYWTLARLDPSNRPALRQLRGIHQRRAQWDMVLQIAELESATSMPPYERAAFEAELGRTWQIHLDDPEEARAAYERALGADPDCPPALEGLANLHQEAGRHRDAARILERLTERLRGPERAPVWISLGTLFAGPLEDSARARACFTAALDDDPFQAPAVEWSLLLATADEDWSAVSELLESRFDLASGARSRAAIAVEASQIQLNHLGSSAGARAWVDRALDLGGEEPAVLLASSAVERADGDREALLGALDKLMSVAGEHAPRESLVEAAELHAEFGHRERALEAIQRASERSLRGDERILLLEARLLREDGQKQALADVLETLTSLEGSAQPAERAAQLRELATLEEQDLGEEAAALTHWQRAFDLEPGEGPALDALERLYRKNDDWSGLRDALERARDGASDPIPADLSARLGLLVLEHFEEEASARTLLESALSVDPQCARALGGLRKLADASGDPDLLLEVCEREAADCRDRGQMGELARCAIPILEERGDLEAALDWATRWTELSSDTRDAFALRADLERRLERPEAEIESLRVLSRLESKGARSKTLERQAALHRRLDQDVEAATALELALEVEPNERRILESLCSVYRALDHATELARTLRQLADRVPAVEQSEVLEELATLLQDPLGDLDNAIVVRWRLADLPDCPDEAPRKLEALLEISGRYAELVQLYFTRRQSLGDDSAEAFELDMRRATLLLDSLGHCDEAAEIFRQLHERHPESDEIIDLLERALRGSDDAQALCDLLERRAGWEDNPERKAEFALERAELTEDTLGEPRLACDLYEAILRDHNDSPSADIADRRLERLLETTEQWDRLRDHLEARAEAASDADAATLREQIATLCRDRLHDIAGCAAQLERIAELTTDRLHVWQQLERIYSHELDRPSDWLRVANAELATEPTAQRELELRVAAARLCLDEDRCPDGHSSADAFDHYERILELEPTHPEAAEVLAMHYTSAERHEEAARILRGRLDHLSDHSTADATDLQLRLGRLYAGPLEDDSEARAHFEAARECVGLVPAVVIPLGDLYEREADHAALAELSRAVLAENAFVDDELLFRVRLGKSEHGLGNLEEAASAYRAALVDSPDDREIEDALIELYERLDETDPLIELLEKRLPYAGYEEAIDLRMRLARLNAEGRDAPEEALSHLDWILDAHPQHRDAFDRALELAERLQDPERLVSLLDRSLETSLPTEERADLLERRAHLLADSLGAREQAVLNFREALSLDPQRESARRALRTQLEHLERWPAVLDCLFVEAKESATARRIEIYEEAAELAWSRVNPDASLPWLARLREERPEDPELFARLAEVHRRAGRFEAALRALDQQLDLLGDDDEARYELELQRARLLERELHAPARAIQAYRAAAASASDASEVLVELDRLFDLMGRPAERADILEERLEGVDGEEQEALRRTLASLYCVDLAKPELAIPHLEANARAAAGDPHEEMAALGPLEAALRASGRHEAWIPVAERELELIEADPSIASNTPEEFQRYLREELARTWDELMGDADSALGHLRVLCQDEDRAEGPLGDRLRALLRRTGRQVELAAALTRHVERQGGSGEEWLELARLREEVLLDLRGARDAYRAAESDGALRLDAIRGRRRTSERLRDWEAMATALEDEYQQSDRLQKNERTALARRLGDLCWQRMGEGERAARGYQLALDLDAKDLVALRSMIAVREACGASDEVASLYHTELEVLGTDADHADRRRDVWLRLATIRSARGERQKAIEAYCEAADLARLTATDEFALARLYEAEGDGSAFAETFASWCDREDSGASVRDHLELARALCDQNDRASARARCERATAVDPESAEAWRQTAELAREDGECETAANAFERAADHADASDAAAHFVSAAACIEDSAVERAYDLLTRAIEIDAASLSAHAALTRVCGTLDRPEETECFAERTLELAESSLLDAGTRLEVAVLGGRAARHLRNRNASRAFFEVALEVDPDHAEALEGVAIAHFEDGDYRAARPLLERRIELPGENPERAAQLSMIARGLEDEDLLDAAWARYEEATAEDPGLDDAHAGLVRVHERASRLTEALAALERWSESASESTQRAQAAFRAAEVALSLERIEIALTHLEFATETDPQLASAWLLRCELAADRSPADEMRNLCRAALEAIEPGPLSARISLRAARLAEVANDLDEARQRYAEAARWDPRACEAALSESRLARTSGDWVEADSVLARFIECHPDPESESLAHVHLERGRLLSGPLEEFDGAVREYETALELKSDLGVARTALGSLLLHAPERWREAVAIHREILEAAPTTANSLRAIGRIATDRGQTEIADGAGVVLRALGVASPEEDAAAQASLRFPIHPGPPMSEPSLERLRRLAHQVSEELGAVLRDAVPPRPTAEDDEVDDALRQISAIEDELTAPGLTRLDSEDRQALFMTLAGLFLDPGGNGAECRFRAPLDEALGRWTRRKVKRIVEETTLDELEAIDQSAWADELRAIAAAQVIDRSGGELRSVLRALLVLDENTTDEPAMEGASIATLAGSSDAARRLLARITQQLCERLDPRG